MKKKLALVLAGVMAAASLTGCGGGAESDYCFQPDLPGQPVFLWYGQIQRGC